MVVIITPLGHAQIYKQGVTSVFIMTRINIHYSKSSSGKNNKRYTTHEHDKGF